MNKKILFLAVVVFILAAISWVFKNGRLAVNDVNNTPDLKVETSDNQPKGVENPVTKAAINNDFQSPIDRAKDRVTKKPFGIYVTPQKSPVSPERFQGYHTGTDFETFASEKDSDVIVNAVCRGKIAERTRASGYGGLVVESCMLNGSPITVIYGHLNLESINKKAGDALEPGEKIGALGKGFSQETDRERKHLHLGVHKGASVNIRGYVGYEKELSDWIDPMSIF